MADEPPALVFSSEPRRYTATTETANAERAEKAERFTWLVHREEIVGVVYR